MRVDLAPILVNSMHTARDYSIVRKDKRLLMTKTKLCCLSCRCQPILGYNNIQTAHDWSWWHRWNIEEIDDDSILFDIASCISIIQLSWRIGVREEEIQHFFSLSLSPRCDWYLCEYNGLHRCAEYWPFGLGVEKKRKIPSRFIWEKVKLLLLLETLGNDRFMTINVPILSTKPFDHRSIVVLAINGCNMFVALMFHTRCNCCSSSCNMLSLLVFTLYRHTVHTSTYKLRFRRREEEEGKVNTILLLRRQMLIFFAGSTSYGSR